MRTPKLKQIDLRKRVGDTDEHPDIREGRSYLVSIDGDWSAGEFSREWYGWNFNDWGTSGIQLKYIEAVFQINKR